MKKRLEIYMLCVIAFTAFTIALAYTRYFVLLLFVTWPIVFYGWFLPMTPINVYILTPMITLLCCAILLFPVFLWAVTGRKAWMIGQLFFVILLVFRFMTYAVKFIGTVPK